MQKFTKKFLQLQSNPQKRNFFTVNNKQYVVIFSPKFSHVQHIVLNVSLAYSYTVSCLHTSMQSINTYWVMVFKRHLNFHNLILMHELEQRYWLCNGLGHLPFHFRSVSKHQASETVRIWFCLMFSFQLTSITITCDNIHRQRLATVLSTDLNSFKLFTLDQLEQYKSLHKIHKHLSGTVDYNLVTK